MKKLLFILTVFLPLALTAQLKTTENTITGNPVSVAGLPTSIIQVTGVPLTDGKIGLSVLLNQYSEDDRFSFFEVSEEMFKAFCELENADSTSIALFKKIKSVKMLERQFTQEQQEQWDADESESGTVDPAFYTEITSQLDITGYNQLLKSRNNHSIALFLKKEFGPADNEFLLITNKMVIDIRGDIMIKTIYQMEEMMGYVQQILPN